MKSIIHILLISLATIILVANNVVLQYVEKASIDVYDDQDEEDKSEKNNSEDKVKEYLNSIHNSLTFTYFSSYIQNYLIFDISQLPSMSIDVELLPPNCVKTLS